LGSENQRFKTKKRPNTSLPSVGNEKQLQKRKLAFKNLQKKVILLFSPDSPE